MHNSKLDNIHLCTLAYSKDIKKYGMNSVLSKVKDELCRLEKGFDVVVETGTKRSVICVLGNIVADNLGLHGILGYTESFSHGAACDLCMGSTDDYQLLFKEEQFQLRSRQLYEQHISQLQAERERAQNYMCMVSRMSAFLLNCSTITQSAMIQLT